MAYSSNTSLVLEYQGYVFGKDFETTNRKTGLALDWFHTDPKPTEQEIATIEATQGFINWWAENGGDAVLTERRVARENVARREEDRRLGESEASLRQKRKLKRMTDAEKLDYLLEKI